MGQTCIKEEKKVLLSFIEILEKCLNGFQKRLYLTFSKAFCSPLCSSKDWRDKSFNFICSRCVFKIHLEYGLITRAMPTTFFLLPLLTSVHLAVNLSNDIWSFHSYSSLTQFPNYRQILFARSRLLFA